MSEKGYRKNVAIIVVNAKREILTGERSDLPGVWQLPQGGIDPGEDEDAAMFRELAEEVGCADVRIVARSKELYCYDFPEWLAKAPIAKQYKGQCQRYYVVQFNDDAGPDINQADGEFKEISWKPLDAILEGIVDFKREAYYGAIRELISYIDPGFDFKDGRSTDE